MPRRKERLKNRETRESLILLGSIPDQECLNSLFIPDRCLEFRQIDRPLTLCDNQGMIFGRGKGKGQRERGQVSIIMGMIMMTFLLFFAFAPGASSIAFAIPESMGGMICAPFPQYAL